MGTAEEEGRVLAVLHGMLDAQEAGDVGRVLAALSSRPEAAHMATDSVKWETSWEAAQTRPASKLSDRLSRPIDDVAAALILRDYLEKKFHPPVARDSSEAH